MEAVNDNPHLTSHYGVRKKNSFNSLVLYVLILSLPSDIVHNSSEENVPLTLKVVFQFILTKDNVTKLSLLKDFRKLI